MYLDSLDISSAMLMLPVPFSFFLTSLLFLAHISLKRTTYYTNFINKCKINNSVYKKNVIQEILDESGSCSFSLASHVVACVCVCCMFMLMSNDTLNEISVINVNDLILLK